MKPPSTPAVLLATSSGCRTFTDAGEGAAELMGHSVSALSKEADGSCLGVVDGREVWCRAPSGYWSHLATAGIGLQSVASARGAIFAGGMEEAVLLRMDPGGQPERLSGFEQTPGRQEWTAGGPPLGVRSMAAAVNGACVLAAVHVGGIPRSTDGGVSWTPTIPVMWDVHEVGAHPSLPNFFAAAAAVGLLVSQDSGQSWKVYKNGVEVPGALALAVLEDEVLFSSQDGPFATRSQIWRWRREDESVSQVRGGLPEWLEGKVDTGWMAAERGRAAVVDRGGNLWCSQSGSDGWRRVASDAAYPLALALV